MNIINNLVFLISLAYLILPIFLGHVDRPYPPVIPREQTATAPTLEQKRWALATCALLGEINWDRHDLLGGGERTPKHIARCYNRLTDNWNINDRNDLLERLAWIEGGGNRKEFDRIARYLASASPRQMAAIRRGGGIGQEDVKEVETVLKHRREFGAKSLAAWDYSRYVTLCGWGYVAGYLTEEEAWEKTISAARLLQATFVSWEDLGKNYVVGREGWYSQRCADGIRYYYLKLLAEPDSPWVRLPWKTNLGGAPDADHGNQVEAVAENKGVPASMVASQDLAKAVAWCRDDASLGNADAQFALGWCYAGGWCVPRDLDRADELFQKVADKLSAHLQGNLGYRYSKGNGLPQDSVKAAEWYRRAAERGNANAQCHLGRCYQHGRGVPKDIGKAVEWYRKAAEQEDVIAQSWLGWCYEKGEGVPKDDAKSAEWYRKAADGGDDWAQCQLGECYEFGRGVPKDMAKAEELYRQAAKQGDKKALDALHAMNKQL